jgi:hypothetical protein
MDAWLLRPPASCGCGNKDGWGSTTRWAAMVRRVRTDAGETAELWMMGSQLVPEAVLADDLTRCYGGKPA